MSDSAAGYARRAVAPTLSELIAGARTLDLTHPLSPEFPLLPIYNPVEVAERLSVSEARFLAAERPQVRAIGLDTASLDIGASTDYPAHVAWLPGGRYGIENLANLEAVPPAGAMLFVGAPALRGGSGGPARILALIA